MQIERTTARKPNALIESGHKYDVYETRVLLAALAYWEEDKKHDHIYRIPLKTLFPDSGDKYQRAKVAVRGVMSRVLDISTEPGRHTYINTFESADIFDGTGIMEIVFHKQVRPFLVEMKENGYTPLLLRYTLPIQSAYSVRIYELLRQYKDFQTHRRISLEELRLFLGIPEDTFHRPNDISERIIDRAQEHLRDNTDISFDYKPYKMGRKIGGWDFYITAQEGPQEGVVQLDLALEVVQKKKEPTIEDLLEDLYGKAAVEKWKEEGHTEKTFLEYFEYTKSKAKTNPKFYLQFALEKDSLGTVALSKAPKKQKAAIKKQAEIQTMAIEMAEIHITPMTEKEQEDWLNLLPKKLRRSMMGGGDDATEGSATM